jgi:hypothetical protein
MSFLEHSLDFVSHASPQIFIGMAALTCDVLGMINKSDRRLRAFQGTSAILWAMVSVIVGAWTSVAICGLTIIRSAAAGWIQSRSVKIQNLSAGLLIFSIIAVTAATWSGPISLLPAAASIISTAAVVLTKGVATRAVLTGTAFLWIANGWLWNVPEGVAAGCLSAVAGFYGVYVLMVSRNQRTRELTAGV